MLLRRLSIVLAGIAMLSRAAAGADHDYSNNLEFQRKYPDLACIDTGPLTAEETSGLTAAKLQAAGRQAKVSVTRPRCSADGGGSGTISEEVSGSEYLDRLYARLSSGPVPDGFYNGKVVLSKDRGLADVRSLGISIPKEESLEQFAQRMWGGKYFDRGRMFLKNWIRYDGQDSEDKPKKLEDERLKFPAKLYCGQSLFDSRRESVIIDYRYGVEDRPEGISTDPDIDWLGGKKGLLIRDEIRMVKPGLYLGRAYMHGVFGLYFVLEYAEGTGTAPAADEKDSCWLGHQRQRVLRMTRSDYKNHF